MAEIYNVDLQETVENSFLTYAGHVIQERAIPDVRDGLKFSTRQILYSQFIDKITYDKPFKKAQKSVASAMNHFYVHGDQACYGVLARMAKPFAMRYTLEEGSGNVGDLVDPDDHAAARYLEMRMSKFGNELFTNINKNVIEEWKDNYDQTEKFPLILPTLGFYNIVNGSSGIAVGMSTSIPQFNITDINNSLIKLIDKPYSTFDEIYCIPDFATGGIIINADEVKESLRVGQGKAIKIRAKIEYDSDKHQLLVTEMPYGVYTNTVCCQLARILDEDPNCGIDKFIDATNSKPLIKISLSKKAIAEKVAKRLYKETSLENFYGVNMIMLEDGRFPKQFGLLEALKENLNHQKTMLHKSYEFDLEKAKARLHIIEGLLIALAHIEEVIRIVKNSNSTSEAINSLTKNFLLTEIQAKAILDLKLQRLVNLEVKKLENERAEVILTITSIEEILNNEYLLNNELKKILIDVRNKYGDARRTQILNLSIESEDDDPVEKKSLIVYLTNLNNLYPVETNSLITQSRGGKGAKLKLNKNEYIIDSISGENSDLCFAFSNKGKSFCFSLADMPNEGHTNTQEFFSLNDGESVTNIIAYNKTNAAKFVIFITKNGIVKKSVISEYNIKKGKVATAIKLKDDDEIVNIQFVEKENLGILTKDGHYVIINTVEINEIGRIAIGVKGITLGEEDYVVDARIISNDAIEIFSITKEGTGKRTLISEFPLLNRGAKGSIIQKVKNETLVSFLPLTTMDKEITIVSNKASIKIPVSDILLTNKGAQGTSAKKMADGENIINLIR